MSFFANKQNKLSLLQRLFLLAVTVVILGPLFPLTIQSMAFQWDWPDLLPSVWWFEIREISRLPIAWDYIFSPYSHLYQSILNTLIIGISVTGISLVICLPAARVIARENFKFKSAFEYLFTLPLLLPEVALGLAFITIFIQLGLAGTYSGIIIAHLVPAIPYMLRILTSVYRGLGIEFEEQALILGANRSSVLWHITIPMLLPGIVAGCLFTFLVSSNIFILTFMVGQGSIETLPTLLFSKIGSGALDATAAGLTLIAMLPGLILLLFTEKYVRSFSGG